MATIEEKMTQWEGEVRSTYGSIKEYVDGEKAKIAEAQANIERAGAFADNLFNAVKGPQPSAPQKAKE